MSLCSPNNQQVRVTSNGKQVYSTASRAWTGSSRELRIKLADTGPGALGNSAKDSDSLDLSPGRRSTCTCGACNGPLKLFHLRIKSLYSLFAEHFRYRKIEI